MPYINIDQSYPHIKARCFEIFLAYIHPIVFDSVRKKSALNDMLEENLFACVKKIGESYSGNMSKEEKQGMSRLIKIMQVLNDNAYFDENVVEDIVKYTDEEARSLSKAYQTDKDFRNYTENKLDRVSCLIKLAISSKNDSERAAIIEDNDTEISTSSINEQVGQGSITNQSTTRTMGQENEIITTQETPHQLPTYFNWLLIVWEFIGLAISHMNSNSANILSASRFFTPCNPNDNSYLITTPTLLAI